MTAYIIAYSIVMFLIAATAVSLCVIAYAGRRKVKAERAPTGDGRLFEDVFGENDDKVAYLIVDEHTHRPVYVSPSISRFLGVTAEDLDIDIYSAKRNISAEYNKLFERTYREWDRKGLYTGEFGYGEGRFAKLEAYTTELSGKSYFAVKLYDITELKAEQAEMQRQLDGALEQAAAKSSFLSNMSHEIRTPMNGIMGMMALARMNINNPEKATGYLERAGDLSVFLLGMINDILDISKIESGKMQLFNTVIDVFGFADKIRNMFTGTVTGKGIAFNVETVDLTYRYLEGDEMRLTQVVTNLVSNASKFTPAGGRIDVTFKQLDFIGDRVQLMIRVRDTGKGIAPENIRKIMRPFEQEEASTSHKYGGTGLGLAICDNIVRLMGGNIVIDSTLGKGTDFSVFLSLPTAEPEKVPEAPVERKAIEEKFEFEGCKILLAEDNEVNAEIAVEILESEGAIVTLAHDGMEAVEIFENAAADAFDVLLLDIQMPRLDGRGAARAVREGKNAAGKTVPIVALSADAFVEDVKLSEAAGMDAHVCKPIDFDELRKVCGEVIAAKKPRGGSDAAGEKVGAGSAVEGNGGAVEKKSKPARRKQER